jgi:hypothetical protein
MSGEIFAVERRRGARPLQGTVDGRLGRPTRKKYAVDIEAIVQLERFHGRVEAIVPRARDSRFACACKTEINERIADARDVFGIVFFLGSD